MISLTKKSQNYRDLQKDSVKLFYQNSWHGLYPARFNIAPTRLDKDSVAMFVNFNKNNYTEGCFPEILGRLIYRESF